MSSVTLHNCCCDSANNGFNYLIFILMQKVPQMWSVDCAQESERVWQTREKLDYANSSFWVLVPFHSIVCIESLSGEARLGCFFSHHYRIIWHLAFSIALVLLCQAPRWASEQLLLKWRDEIVALRWWRGRWGLDNKYGPVWVRFIRTHVLPTLKIAQECVCLLCLLWQPVGVLFCERSSMQKVTDMNNKTYAAFFL